MKRLFIVTILVFSSILSLYSQSLEGELDQMREWFKEINLDIGQYEKVEYPDINVYKDINPKQYSFEGEKVYRLASVSMKKYFDDGQLVKMALQFNGDREDLISEYYFKDDNLFFVDKIRTVYHKPKWDATFRESEKSIDKNHFYIKDNHLLKWIDSDVNSMSKKHPSYRIYEAMILNDYQLYKSIN